MVKKRIIISIVLIAVIVVVAAVSVVILIKMGFGDTSPKKEYNSDLTADELATAVIYELDYNDLTQVSASNISRYYDLSDGLVSDAAVYISSNTDSCLEISCFKLEESSGYDELEAAIRAHLGAQSGNIKHIAPQESENISKSRIEYCDPYVLVAVTQNSDSAAAVFKNLVITNASAVESR